MRHACHRRIRLAAMPGAAAIGSELINIYPEVIAIIVVCPLLDKPLLCSDVGQVMYGRASFVMPSNIAKPELVKAPIMEDGIMPRL